MLLSRNIILLPLLAGACLWAIRECQISTKSPASAPLAGPDVIVGDIPSINRWGADTDETAFSIGTTSCNIGTTRLDWIQSTNVHPVISQNLYRVRNGRIEMLGMSWLKHGFSVAAGSLCNTCTDPASSYLGVGCSDPYGASLNGSQSLLGPRSQVNAATGIFTMPHGNLPSTGTLDGRLRVFTNDINPSLNSGARYFVESLYVHPQDSSSGNGANSASYREAFVETEPGGGWDIETNSTAQTVRQNPAINAWKAVHSDVRLFNVDVPGDGRIIVGVRTTPGTGGGYHTEIAVENLTSHQSVGSLKATFGTSTISNPGFRDCDYQFESYSGADWTSSTSSNNLTWTTQTFAVNQNANAIRWNTLYSFWCDSALPVRKLTLGMFRPGTVTEMAVNLVPTFAPQRYRLVQGTTVSGQLSDLATSNNQYWRIAAGPTSNPLPNRSVTKMYRVISPTTAPTDFAFRVEAAMAGGPSGDVMQKIELFNFSTQLFEQVDSRSVAVTDSAVEITPTGAWSRFLEPGTREVRSRVTWSTPAGFSGTPFAWTIDIDEAVWLIAN